MPGRSPDHRHGFSNHRPNPRGRVPQADGTLGAAMKTLTNALRFRGLASLTWLEIKIFMREPLGVIGSVFVPVIVFIVMSRLLGDKTAGPVPGRDTLSKVDLAVFAALFIAINAVLS